MSRHHKIPADKWLLHRDFIERLWVDERKSCAFIITELAKLGFFVNKRQFEYQVVTKWGYPKFDKSNLQNPRMNASGGNPAISSARPRTTPSEPSSDEAPQTIGSNSSQNTSGLPAPDQPELSFGRWTILPLGLPFKSRNARVCYCMAPLSLCEQWRLDHTYEAAHQAQVQGDYLKAETLYRMAARDIRLLDDCRFFIYRSVAVCLLNQGRIEDALEHALVLLDISDRVLRPTDYLRLCVLRTIASIQEARGDLDAAQTQCESLLQIGFSDFGSTHAFTIATMSSLAGVLRLKEHHAQSAATFRKVLDSRPQTANDAGHTCQDMRQLADVLSDTGRLDESIALYRLAESRALSSLGAAHQATLRIQSNLGADLRLVGHLLESEQLLLTATAGQKALPIAACPDSSWTEYQYAKCLIARGQYSTALSWFRQIRDFRTARLGEHHVRTLHCDIWLGWCYENLQQHHRAQQHYYLARSKLEPSANNTYAEDYRRRWIELAIARTAWQLGYETAPSELLERPVEHDERVLEIENKDGSPVQCVIELESVALETRAVAT